jgi:hypothetical protein
MTKELLKTASDIFYELNDAKAANASDLSRLDRFLNTLFPNPDLIKLIEDDVYEFKKNVSTKLEKLIEEKQKEFDAL